MRRTPIPVIAMLVSLLCQGACGDDGGGTGTDPMPTTADTTEGTGTATETSSGSSADTSPSTLSTTETESETISGAIEDTATAALVFPEDPGEVGPCGFEKLTLKVPSSEGNYQISAILYVPSIGDSGAPAVVINHGNQIPGNMYSNLAEHLASWCYVAAINDYVSTLVPATPPERIVRDTMDVLRFVMSASDPSLEGVVRSEGGAVVGHSKGGAMGLWAAAENPELVHAAVGLDPVYGHGTIEHPGVFETLQVPTMVLGELFSATHAIGGQECAPATSNFQQFYALLSAGLPALEVTFTEAMHMSWLNAPKGCGVACAACPDNPKADHEAVRSLSRRYTTAWLELHLRGRAEVETYLFGQDMAGDIETGAVSVQSK